MEMRKREGENYFTKYYVVINSVCVCGPTLYKLLTLDL